MHPLVSQMVALLEQVRQHPSCMAGVLWMLHRMVLSRGWREIMGFYNRCRFNSKQKRNRIPIINNYLLQKTEALTIGEGTFNKVKIGRHVYTNEQVAVKMIEKRSVSGEADQLRLKKELKILRKVRHPHIVQLYEILEDKEYYYLVTEYASRGELFQHIVKNQKLTQFEASKFLQQLLDAIQYLHEIGVVHRDLKPQNILLDYKYNVKIADFGLSDIYCKGEKLTTACGSPCYAPPEMLAGKGYDPLKVDIWSLGIVLYAMCFGYLPFDHPDPSELFKIIKAGQYELPEHASQELTDILQLILEVDPLKRSNIQEIRGHRFCSINQVPVALGIIQGLSTMPFEQRIEARMRQLHLDTAELQQDISGNKHNDRTATYYLLLQQDLRQRNQTILNYYLDKHYIINRYKLIEKVKDQYEKRLILRICTLEQSRQMKIRNSEGRKKSKTSEKKYHTGLASNNSKTVSKNLFHTPSRARHSKEHSPSRTRLTPSRAKHSKENKQRIAPHYSRKQLKRT